MRIKNFTLFSCLVLIALGAYASMAVPFPITEQNTGESLVFLDCDTIVSLDGYAVRLVKNNGEEVYSGLNLFSPEMKESADKDLLSRIESDLYKMIIKKSDTDVKTKLVKGMPSAFKSITPETSCVITLNARNIVVDWEANGKPVEVILPVSYETAKGNNRSEIENLLINKLKESDGIRKPFHIEKSNLESYGENLFILPAESYQNKDITRNIYLDSELIPIWDSNYSNESIANLFLFPSEKYGDILMDLTILKHEYGEKETITIPVTNLLSEMEKDGCISYWGVERMNGGLLEGALFLFNPKQGYDHVLKIECEPEKVIDGDGNIKGRVSLYIPTNNVNNLNAPYIRKSDDERINYRK